MNYNIKIIIKEEKNRLEFFFNYNPLETIETVKNKVFEKIYKMHPVEEIRLFYKEKELDDSKTLFCYGFKDSKKTYEFTIYYGPKNGGLIDIKGNYGFVGRFYMGFSSKIVH